MNSILASLFNMNFNFNLCTVHLFTICIVNKQMHTCLTVMPGRHSDNINTQIVYMAS
jgi:hypothetical protein